MDLCSWCHKKLRPGTVLMCKCETIVFCSNNCYKAAMVEHKRRCPGITSFSYQYPVSSLYSCISVYLQRKEQKTKNLVDLDSSTVLHTDTTPHHTTRMPNNTGQSSMNPGSLEQCSSGQSLENPGLSKSHIPGTTDTVSTGSKPIQGCNKNSSSEFQPPIKRLKIASNEPRGADLTQKLGLVATSCQPKQDSSKERERDRKGRFEKNLGIQYVSTTQKKQNKVASRVTKIKRTIVENMKKIQNLRCAIYYLILIIFNLL